MRILITGGSGLIGTSLIKHFLSLGYEVVSLTRKPIAARPGEEQPFSTVHWDGKSAAGWGPLADGAKAIINLAGENISAGRWTEQRKRAIIHSRINAGIAVLQAVEQAKVKPEVIIQASGVGYYGISLEKEFREEDPPGSDYLSQVCIGWEQANQQVEEYGVRRAVIRLGVVLSTDGGALPKMMLPFRLFVGGSVGNGKQWMPWVHPADVCGAIQFIIENSSAQGAFNLCAPQQVTNRQFSQAIAHTLHRPAWIPLPALALKLALGEMSTVLLEGQRVLPSRLQGLGYHFLFPELVPALADLLG